MKTDISELNNLIELPVNPTAVRYQVIEQPGGTDWSLIAALDFGDNVAEIRKMTQATPQRSGDAGFVKPDWLDQQEFSSVSEMSDQLIIFTDAIRSADPFFKSPLINGFIVLPEGTSKALIYLGTQ